MRTAKVFTNLACNQACRHCTSRAPSDAPSFVALQAVRQRLASARAMGAEEVVLTGGEPTMRRDLPGLVATAKRVARDVGLETNATLVTPELAKALRAAGLSWARVNLTAASSELDEVTRDPGGYEASRAGIAALAAEGVPLEVSAVAIAPTLAHLPALPDALAALAPGAVRTLQISVPVASPEDGLLVPYERAAPVIASVDVACRRVGIRLRIAPDSGPPPCVFPRPARVAHLYTMTPGASARDDFRRVPACRDCLVQDRCLGFPVAYLDRWGVPEVKPVVEERERRRLSIATSVDEQTRRELVAPNRHRLAEGGVIDERIVRINFQCNQACGFCFVSTHLPSAGEDRVRAAILEAAAVGARVVISGGEPTLNAKLVEYVALARQATGHEVQIQTNAILLDDAARVDALVAAGVGDAFVSLHAATADVSDGITEAPGTFVRTLVGIDNLHARGVRVMLNFVLCVANRGHLRQVIELVAARWPRARLSFSFVAASTDIVPLTKDLIPRYSDVLPEIADALEASARLGVEVHGFDTMCGVPLCLVPSGAEDFFALDEIPAGSDGGEFVRPEACSRCDLASRCFGVRRRYAELHGTDEIHAVTRA